MSKKIYVYSTLSSDQIYTQTRPGGGDLPVVERDVFIAGKANIPDRRLITPRGVVTAVTAEELELLRGNEVFKLHEANGFISVSDKHVDPEVAASGMVTRDQSAPLEDGDFEAAREAHEDNPGVAVPARKSSRKA